jgi:hypothetical protein
LITASNFVATSLLMPLILAIAAYLIGEKQKETALNLAEQEKLASAYIAFGDADNSVHKAMSAIDLMANANPEAISYPKLRDAVLAYDAALDSVGPRLAPFEEVASRQHAESLRKEISLTWRQCFVRPFYGAGGANQAKSYWRRIQDQLRTCTAKRCPRAAAEKISYISWESYSGTCVCGNPTTQRPLSWFYPRLQSVMLRHPLKKELFEKGPDRPHLAPVNPDLVASGTLACPKRP